MRHGYPAVGERESLERGTGVLSSSYGLCETVEYLTPQTLELFQVISFSGEHVLESYDQSSIAELGCLIDPPCVIADDFALRSDILVEKLAGSGQSCRNVRLYAHLAAERDDFISEKHCVLQLARQLFFEQLPQLVSQ